MPTGAEQENMDLVKRFCADWARQDAELLADYFADSFEYMVWEGGPVITGKAEFIKQMGPFLKKLKSVDWEVLRSEAIGSMVINERIDHFYAHDSKHDNHPHLLGMFIVRDGKIAVWRDYNLR